MVIFFQDSLIVETNSIYSIISSLLSFLNNKSINFFKKTNKKKHTDPELLNSRVNEDENINSCSYQLFFTVHNHQVAPQSRGIKTLIIPMSHKHSLSNNRCSYIKPNHPSRALYLRKQTTRLYRHNLLTNVKIIYNYNMPIVFILNVFF